MRFLLFIVSVLVVFPVVGQNVVDKSKLKGQVVYYCAPCGCQYDEDFFDCGGICQACNMPLYAAYEGAIKQRPPLPRIVVGLLIFEDADIMDVTGPWSVFSHSGFEVATFAKEKSTVTLSGGLALKPDFTLESLPDVDVLVFPGSGLAETNPGDAQIMDFINDRFAQTETIFSVCSGAFFLAEAGVLKNQEATTFASMIPLLSNYPGVKALSDVKYTDNGKIVTSGGLSSGIDAAFHVIAKIRGAGFAQDVANTMEYPRSLKYDYARSQLADNFLIEIRSIARLFTRDYIDSEGDNNSWRYTFALDNQVSSKELLAAVSREMKKNDRWMEKKNEADKLSGVINHPSLGKADVNLIIKEDRLTLTAERARKYVVPSY